MSEERYSDTSRLNAVARFCPQCDRKVLVDDPAQEVSCPTCKLPMHETMSERAVIKKAKRRHMADYLDLK